MYQLAQEQLALTRQQLEHSQLRDERAASAMAELIQCFSELVAVFKQQIEHRHYLLQQKQMGN